MYVSGTRVEWAAVVLAYAHRSDGLRVNACVGKNQAPAMGVTGKPLLGTDVGVSIGVGLGVGARQGRALHFFPKEAAVWTKTMSIVWMWVYMFA